MVPFGGKIVPAFLLALTLLAPAPAQARESALADAVEALNIPLYHLDGRRWITLPDLQFALGGTLTRSRTSRRAELTFGSCRAVFRPESRHALFNGVLTDMGAPVRLVNGVEAIPLEFALRMSAPGFRPEPAGPDGPGPVKPDAAAEPNLMDLLSQALHPGLDEIIAEAVQKEEMIIVIDPGHGGEDAGAIGPYGLKEKDVVLDIARRMKDYLARKHPKSRLIMTREEDYFVTLEERVRIANNAGADIFVSVHANAARLNRYLANGFETFYPLQKAAAPAPGESHALYALPPNPYTPRQAIGKSRYLAALMQEELSDIFIEEIPNRGVKGRSFYVLRYTHMPAVLVEVGFISNPNIELNLRQPSVRQRIAEALGHGVSAYLEGRALRPEVHTDTPLVQELPADREIPPGH